MGEPLETRYVGLGEWLQQSFYIAPAVLSQHALKPQRLHLANTLIASTYAEVQTAASDWLNPRFVVDFSSSALHERVAAIKIKNNPDPMKICCEAMRDAFAPEAGDKLLEEQGS